MSRTASRPAERRRPGPGRPRPATPPWAPSWARRPRSPPRCAPPPGSTGCCSIWSTAPAARNRSATSSRPPVPTECPPWSGSRPTRGSGWAGCWTTVPRESCCPAWTVPLQVAEALTHLRYPAARGPGRRHLQPGLPIRARPRRSGPGRRRDPRGRRRSNPRPRSTAADEIAAVDGVDVLFIGPRDLSATTSASPVTPPPRRSSRRWTRCWPPASGTARPAGCSSPTAPPRPPRARTGLDVRGHRLRLHPARRRLPRGARPPPAPLTAELADHLLTQGREPSWLDTSTTRASPRSVSA